MAILTERITHYRAPFFNGLRDRLQSSNIRLRLLVASSGEAPSERNDSATLDWAEIVPTRRVSIGGRELIWQHCLSSLRTADLVIAEQATRLLTAQALAAWRYAGGPRLAWWGHGVNLDKEKASRMGETLKRQLATRADWWFCYTENTARIVSQLGVDENRITVVQNAVDTEALRGLRDALTAADVTAARRDLGLGDGPVALWLSSIYDRKRPEFMVDAADHIRERLPNFELLVIGDGPRRVVFDNAARTRPWIHLLGARNSLDLVRPAATARILVNPGLVGLTVLDGFALGLPMVTCDLPYHSPEFEYLEHGVNGMILPRTATPLDFAQECARLLGHEEARDHLAKGSRSSDKYTIEAMSDRFAAGIGTIFRQIMPSRPPIADQSMGPALKREHPNPECCSDEGR